MNNIEKRLQEGIIGKRSLAKRNRLDRIEALKEALIIAKELKVVDLTKLQSFANMQGEIMLPLYLLGEAAIQSELSVLKSRKNDDPFIPGLRDIQEQLIVLDSISIDEDKVAVIRLDQSAIVPNVPINPKKALIIGLFFMLGLMLGMCVAFVRNAVRRNAIVR